VSNPIEHYPRQLHSDRALKLALDQTRSGRLRRKNFWLLSGQRLRRKKSLENSRNEKRTSRNAEACERNKCAINASFNTNDWANAYIQFNPESQESFYNGSISAFSQPVRASVFNNNVLGFYISQVTQALSEFLNARGERNQATERLPPG